MDSHTHTPSQTDTAASKETVVRIFDTPIENLPDDLYIPPQAFAIWLEQFAGPLDFLLYLVKKNNFDLTETAILPITEQYLRYISELDEAHFELAGDYLLMASTLIAIKSELLLPKPAISDDEMSPKARLIQRLEEYAQIKTATQRLDKLLRLERDVFLAYTSMPSTEAMQRELPSYSPELLVNSLINMQIRPLSQTHSIPLDTVPLPERIASITRKLSETGFGSFYDILDKSQGKLGVVVSFVAVLELIKRGLVGFSDDGENTDDSSDDDIAFKPARRHKKSSGTDNADATNTASKPTPTAKSLSTQTLYWLH